MELVIVGAHHAQMPLVLREQVAIAAAELPAALSALVASAREGFILSTCNRTEIIALVEDAEAGIRALIDLLAAVAITTSATIAPHLHTTVGTAAIERLLTIAAGLDSMVLGEDQILAQLKGALDAATAAGTLGPIMHRLGATALSAGKRARAETPLGRGNLSVVSVALREAQEALGDLRERHVLIIGAGDTGELALKHLLKNAREQPASIAITNRTTARAEALVEDHNVTAIPWETRATALADADLVLCCTAAPGTILSRDDVAAALAARPARPLVCLDLAVPRDIDPAVAALPGVLLRDVDALAPICAAARRQRQGAIVAAQAIVAEEVARFGNWWRARAIAPTITALREQVTTIGEAEVQRALDRLPELSERDVAIVRGLATSLINKLLHAPTVALRTSDDGEALALAAATLFGLEAAKPTPASPAPQSDTPWCGTSGHLQDLPTTDANPANVITVTRDDESWATRPPLTMLASRA
jgi:glutamyl-tRNA reductase